MHGDDTPAASPTILHLISLIVNITVAMLTLSTQPTILQPIL